ncbi:hypothetical protein FE782_31595 [Paenibacillus antri]|uniref:Lipoprotein n=1 Tax=Paenibacillus antri TaxID=2582848 RepID=A0A5R9G2B1_9BACL|nr:hypothetical protein [Paenibacillus antri]TLS48290.1 hypothetical protein FE782_31595 [Paenibacillus antri]
MRFVISGAKALVIICLLSGCAGSTQPLPDEPIVPSITVNGEAVALLDGGYCWAVDEEKSVCSSPLPPDTLEPMIEAQSSAAASGAAVRIRFLVPPDRSGVLVRSGGLWVPAAMHDAERFMLPKRGGYYRFLVWGEWGERNTASYHFGVFVAP